MIQREFQHFERPKTVSFSHSDFSFVVQALDNAAGKRFFCPEIVEQQLAVVAHGAGEFLERLNP